MTKTMTVSTNAIVGQTQPDIQLAKYLTMALLSWNKYHGIAGDKWCPYDVLWILKRRIAGGRVIVLPRPKDDGWYTVEVPRLRALWSNRKIPQPEFLAIAAIDKWMAFPVIFHRSEVVEGSILPFCESEFARDAASERLARCANLLDAARLPGPSPEAKGSRSTVTD